MQLLFLQDNTTTSSSGLTPEGNQHQRKSEEQVGLTISSNSVTNSFNKQFLKERENIANEKDNSSEVEKAEVPLKVKEKTFSSESNIHFFQEVMIDGAAETSMSEKVDSSADLYYSI